MSDSETERFKVSGKDTRETLVALRDRLALALDNEAIGVKEIVQVSRRLEAVTAQLAKLDEGPARRGRPPKSVAQEVNEPVTPEEGGSVSNELARRRAERRASAS